MDYGKNRIKKLIKKEVKRQVGKKNRLKKVI